MTKYQVFPTKKFKRDVNVLRKRGYDMSLLEDVVTKLANGEKLSAKHCDHPLKGERKGYRDCHILNDWVLVYKIDKGILTLILSETGTHAGLFK
jgi:mRNA interferase YafQ